MDQSKALGILLKEYPFLINHNPRIVKRFVSNEERKYRVLKDLIENRGIIAKLLGFK